VFFISNLREIYVETNDYRYKQCNCLALIDIIVSLSILRLSGHIVTSTPLLLLHDRFGLLCGQESEAFLDGDPLSAVLIFRREASRVS